MRYFLATFLLATLIATPAAALDGGRYGEVRIAVPDGDIRGYVVFFSDHGGWTKDDEQVLVALKAEGALAIGVDTDRYLRLISPGDRKCDQLVGDAESLSHQLQREHSGVQYQFPILAGIGEGATLAGAVLTEARVDTLGGAVSLDPAPTLKGARPICPGEPASPDGNGNFEYGPVKSLEGFWTVGLSPAASEAARSHLEALVKEGTPLAVETSVGMTDQAIATLVKPHLYQGSAGGIADLPLVELPAGHPSPLMAIVLSGDGGWRDLDRTVAGLLQKQGVSVVGWDSLRYFWRKKTPEQTAADLALVLRTYGAKWHATRFALIGYSFGADVLPFAYNLLPDGVRSHVALLSLLAFAPKADWEITVSGWLGASSSAEAVPVKPAVAAIPGRMIQCVYGQEEGDTACPGLAERGADVVMTSGGHHFDGDYDALAQRILRDFRKRSP
jgi:type IV secretory pathway VirJ component